MKKILVFVNVFALLSAIMMMSIMIYFGNLLDFNTDLATSKAILSNVQEINDIEVLKKRYAIEVNYSNSSFMLLNSGKRVMFCTIGFFSVVAIANLIVVMRNRDAEINR